MTIRTSIRCRPQPIRPIRLIGLIGFLALTAALSAASIAPAQAQTFNFAKELRTPLRQNLADCNVFLTPADLGAIEGGAQLTGKVDDGVGTPVATSLDPAQTEASLKTIIRENSRAFLHKAQISVTGVGMRDAQKIRTEFEQMIARNGWSDLEMELKVFAVPRTLIERRAVQTVTDLWEQTRYFLPSLWGRDNLDYQTPTLAEIKQGFASTAVIELLNAVFVKAYTGANGIETSTALSVLGVHFSILAAYTVYNKTLVNWILRTGAHQALAQKAIGITKNMITALPFVMNYYLFGQWDRMMADSQSVTTAQAVGQELVKFAITQGPTLFIHGICYNLVISNGVWKWAYSREGEQKQRTARAAGNWVAAPIQTTIAMLLSVASFNLHPLFEVAVGPSTLSTNMGQLLYAGFTISGVAAFSWIAKHNPDALDFSLTWYEKASAWFRRIFKI